MTGRAHLTVHVTAPAFRRWDDGTVVIVLDPDGRGEIIVDDTDTSLALAQAAMDAHEALAARQRVGLAAELAQPRYEPISGPISATFTGEMAALDDVERAIYGDDDEDVPRPGSGHPDPTQPGAGPGHQDPPGVDLAGGRPLRPGEPGDGGEPAVVAAAAVLPAEAPPGDETCDALHEHWICTASPGHDGGHVAHGVGGEVVHTWPQEVTP